MGLALGAAAAVQQLVEHGQHGQGDHGEDEEQQDDEAGHVPAVVERVHLLHLHGDPGEQGHTRRPREASGRDCGVGGGAGEDGGAVGHGL